MKNALANGFCVMAGTVAKCGFVAGSMFWVKPRPISSLLKLQVTEFEVESGLADGTLAYSVERVIVNVVEDTGYEVSDI